MARTYVVRGRVSDARHIELDEPIEEGSEVHVVVVTPSVGTTKKRVDIMDHIRSLKPGTRTKEDIDRQIKEERDSWGD